MTCATPTRTTIPDGFEVRSVHLSDPLVRPLLDDLHSTYVRLYASLFGEEMLGDEMSHYEADEFLPPHGDFILLMEGGVAIAGGAFRRRTEPEEGDISRSPHALAARDASGAPAVPTAELKRIWTHSDHRRRGLARIVLTELEARVAEAGYERLFLTTGSRQPEAASLYVATGYTRLYDALTHTDADGPLAFEKWLVPPVP